MPEEERRGGRVAMTSGKGKIKKAGRDKGEYRETGNVGKCQREVGRTYGRREGGNV